MKVLLVNNSGKPVPFEAWLSKWAKSLATLLTKKGFKTLKRKELVVVFVSSTEMKRLNHQYRGKDYATDVLSFDSADPDCIGELVLCLPVLRAQSKRTGLSERGELGYMIVHGVLHLLGFDHETKKDEIKMFALQDGLYATLEKRVGLR
jgi:probable rRNA maturation factor